MTSSTKSYALPVLAPGMTRAIEAAVSTKLGAGKVRSVELETLRQDQVLSAVSAVSNEALHIRGQAVTTDGSTVAVRANVLKSDEVMQQLHAEKRLDALLDQNGWKVYDAALPR